MQLPLDGSVNASSSLAVFKLPYDGLCTALMQLIATILTCLAKNNPAVNSSDASAERMSGSGDAFMNRGNDLIRCIILMSV